LWLDTSQPTSHGIYAIQDAPPIATFAYQISPRAIVALVAITKL
jgi:hypothetical protein